MAKAMAIVVVATVAMAVLLTGVSAMSCMQVDFELLPCLGYLRSGGNVPSMCCGGLRGLVNSAKTTDDRRSACSCLKSLAKHANNDQLGRAATLPDKCGVPIPFKISPDIDCSQIF